MESDSLIYEEYSRELTDLKYSFSRPLSAELQALCAVSPRLLDFQDLTLCEKNTINTIGSLISSTLADEYRQSFEQAQRPVPSIIDKFIEFVPTVHATASHEKNNWGIDVGDIDHVIWKRGCGKSAGFVYKGPMAGLTLMHEPSQPEYSRIIRLMSDKYFNPDELESYPDVVNFSAREDEYVVLKFRNIIYRKVEDLVFEAAGINSAHFNEQDRWKGLQKLKNKIKLSQILELQCKKMGIPLKAEDLHMAFIQPALPSILQVVRI